MDYRGDGPRREGRVSAGDHRCLPLPSDVERALTTSTPKGQCKIGWIVADAGRNA